MNKQGIEDKINNEEESYGFEDNIELSLDPLYNLQEQIRQNIKNIIYPAPNYFIIFTSQSSNLGSAIDNEENEEREEKLNDGNDKRDKKELDGDWIIHQRLRY